MRTGRITLGILADVDAGKTTLAERMLYTCGSIRNPGRVDHGDSHMDTHELERARGITIFSSQASLSLNRGGGGTLTADLLDTPGHVDFSAETERTLYVLDYALLVISAGDGVRSRVRILWSLLSKHGIPVFIFVNKMDLPGADKAGVLENLRKELGAACVDFSGGDEASLWEEAALCDERLLDLYLENQKLDENEIASAVGAGKVVPCFFGSALKDEGVDELLKGLAGYTAVPARRKEFGARVYKIGRDPAGTRLTYMKVTGGSLRSKQILNTGAADEIREEKADQLRAYTGASYESVREADAGALIAVTGLEGTHAGQGLGFENDAPVCGTQPVMSYTLIPPAGTDMHRFYKNVSMLGEELPELDVRWSADGTDITLRVMGEIQLETLKSLIKNRFDTDVEFGEGSIIYKETAGKRTEGVGHFEPLRHYAEVHLIIEPLPPGSGVVVESTVSEDRLDRNYQGQVTDFLKTWKAPGVLTGAELTDVRIVLADGRSHPKHTEGGDFREAAARALRQGLMKAQCVLLEPYYEYGIEVPADRIGRAMADIQRMTGEVPAAEERGTSVCLRGRAPAAAMQGYASEVRGYTRGEGRVFLAPAGYAPCSGGGSEGKPRPDCTYNPDADISNPTGSVFCAHGSGFYVPWNEVEDYMHLPSVLTDENRVENRGLKTARRSAASAGLADPKELEEIFERTYGPIRRDRQGVGRQERVFKKEDAYEYRPGKAGRTPGREYLLVDGYNIIFTWDELKALAETGIEAARGRLMDILSNLQGVTGVTIILVFDAYRVEGAAREIFKYHNIYVVFTKEAETADMYIEKTVHELGRNARITVATSDALEQVIIAGAGAVRMSARDLHEYVEMKNRELREFMDVPQFGGKTYMLDGVSKDALDKIKKS